MEYEDLEAEVYAKSDKEQRVSKIMEDLVKEARRRLERKMELDVVENVGVSEDSMRFL